MKKKNATLTETKITYNNNVITHVLHTKFLGLETENMLSWNLHIDNVIKKLTTVCHMLRSANVNVGAFLETDDCHVGVYYKHGHLILK